MNGAENQIKAVLGRNVRFYRKQRHMKQDELGRGVGYADHTQISNIERGLMLPSTLQLIAIARYLQQPVDALLREHPQPLDRSKDLVSMIEAWPEPLSEGLARWLLRLHQWYECAGRPDPPGTT